MAFYYRLPKNNETIWNDVIKIYERFNKTALMGDKIKIINEFMNTINGILKLNNNFNLKNIYFKIIRKNYLRQPDETFMKLVGYVYGILNMYNISDINYFIFGDYSRNDLYKAYKNNVNDMLEENFKIKKAINWIASIETIQLIEMMAKRRLTLKNLNI